MTEDSLLGSPQLTSDQDVVIDPAKKYVDELVGEGKKFTDVEELAKGKYKADEYIKHKNREFDELRADYLRLREEYDSGQKLKDIVDRMSMQPTRDTTHVPPADTKPEYNLKELESLVSNQISAHEMAQKRMSNFNQVKAKLQERHGSNYSNVVAKQLEDLGLSQEWLNDNARTAPAAVIRVLGLDQAPSREAFDSPARSTTRGSTSDFKPATTAKPWSYYKAMKEKDRRAFLDAKTQTQMIKDHMTLGDSFEDGDFNSRSF